MVQRVSLLLIAVLEGSVLLQSSRPVYIMRVIMAVVMQTTG